MLGRSSLHQSVTPRLGRRTRSRSPLRPVAGGRGNIHVMRVGGVRADASVRSGRPSPPRAPSLPCRPLRPHLGPGPRVGRSVPTHLLTAGACCGGWLPASASASASHRHRRAVIHPRSADANSRRPPPDPFRSVPSPFSQFLFVLVVVVPCVWSVFDEITRRIVSRAASSWRLSRALHGCTSGSLFFTPAGDGDRRQGNGDLAAQVCVHRKRGENEYRIVSGFWKY